MAETKKELQQYREEKRLKQAIKKAIEKKDMEKIDLLLKTKDLSNDVYCEIFCHIWIHGRSWMYQKILEESDFIHWLKKNKQRLRKEYEKNLMDQNDLTYNWFDNILLPVVLTGDPCIVKLFIDNKFNVNARFNHAMNESWRCRKLKHFVNALAWAENLGYTEIAEMLFKAGATREKQSNLIYCALKPASYYTLQMVHKLCENGRSAEILGQWNSKFISRNDIFHLSDAISRAFWTEQYHVVKYMLLRGAGPKPIVDHRLFVTTDDWKVIVFLILTSNATVSWGYYLKRILEDSMFEIQTSGDSGQSLKLLLVINQASWYTSLRDLIESSLILQDVSKELPLGTIQHHDYCSPKRLQALCRVKLRSHFRNYLYLRFLRNVHDKVPPSIYSYLSMHDLLDLLFTKKERNKFDYQSKAADSYFL